MRAREHDARAGDRQHDERRRDAAQQNRYPWEEGETPRRMKLDWKNDCPCLSCRRIDLRDSFGPG